MTHSPFALAFSLSLLATGCAVDEEIAAPIEGEDLDEGFEGKADGPAPDRRAGLLGRCAGPSRFGGGGQHDLVHGNGDVARLAIGRTLVLRDPAGRTAMLTLETLDGQTAAPGWNIFFSSGRYTDQRGGTTRTGRFDLTVGPGAGALLMVDDGGAPNDVFRLSCDSTGTFAPTTAIDAARFTGQSRKDNQIVTVTLSGNVLDVTRPGESWRFDVTRRATGSTLHYASGTRATAAGTQRFVMTRSGDISGLNVYDASGRMIEFLGLEPNGGATGWAGVNRDGSVARNAEHRFTTPTLRAGTYRFAIEGRGDADLYVRAGSAPTTTVFDCRPFLDGSAETCSVTLSTPGRIHVMVRGFAAAPSGYTLTGR